MLDAEEPPRLWVLLDEAALHRGVGGAAVMRARLEHICEIAARPRVTVQILPSGIGAHPGMLGSFTILGFPVAEDPGVVYIEHRTGSLYLEEPAEVKEHSIAFEHLQSLALSPSDSLDLIVKATEGLT